jgi:hypothetical protein
VTQFDNATLETDDLLLLVPGIMRKNETKYKHRARKCSEE